MTQNTEKNIVFFDLDGTLVNSFELAWTSYNYLANAWLEQYFPQQWKSDRQKLRIWFDRNVNQAAKDYAIAHKGTPQETYLFNLIYNQQEDLITMLDFLPENPPVDPQLVASLNQIRMSATRLLPGVAETLLRLKQAGSAVIIWTDGAFVQPLQRLAMGMRNAVLDGDIPVGTQVTELVDLIIAQQYVAAPGKETDPIDAQTGYDADLDREYVMPLLARAFALPRFMPDGCRSRKPTAVALKTVLDHIGGDPALSVMGGDNVVDVLAARNMVGMSGYGKMMDSFWQRRGATHSRFFIALNNRVGQNGIAELGIKPYRIGVKEMEKAFQTRNVPFPKAVIKQSMAELFDYFDFRAFDKTAFTNAYGAFNSQSNHHHILDMIALAL